MGCGDIGQHLGRVTDAVGFTNYSGDRAIEAQANAANSANATQRYIYDQQRSDQEPWRQTGVTALAGLSDPNFGKNLEMDPGYQFRMREGEKAINAAAAARGNYNSGATLKALARYGQDYASNEYDKAYNRQYARLSSLAGIGSNANNALMGASQNYGNNVSANQIGLGNANAANQVASVNRFSNLLGQFAQGAGEGAGKAGGAAMFSDRRLKTNIVEIPKSELNELKKNLKAFKFNYKDSSLGNGDFIGVMAQDLEKSRLGRLLISIDENGFKKLDINKVMHLFLATLAEG